MRVETRWTNVDLKLDGLGLFAPCEQRWPPVAIQDETLGL